MHRIIILMPIEPEILQVLIKKTASLCCHGLPLGFSSWSTHHWKNLLRHAGELADATDE